MCWHRFSHQTQVAFRLLFIVFFSLSFFSYYTNGEDWSVYYLRFIEDEGLFTSFEFGFVIILKLLLIVSDDKNTLSIPANKNYFILNGKKIESLGVNVFINGEKFYVSKKITELF